MDVSVFGFHAEESIREWNGQTVIKAKPKVKFRKEILR